MTGACFFCKLLQYFSDVKKPNLLIPLKNISTHCVLHAWAMSLKGNKLESITYSMNLILVQEKICILLNKMLNFCLDLFARVLTLNGLRQHRISKKVLIVNCQRTNDQKGCVSWHCMLLISLNGTWILLKTGKFLDV